MDMKRIGIAGMCLVAALAFSVVVAGSAWATAPEYGRCIKKKTKSLPAYSNSKCTLEAKEIKTASYEWVPGAAKTKFTSTGGVGVLETVGNAGVECSGEKSDGEFEPGNNKEETGIFVTFTGCKAEGLPCTSAGHAAGELETNELEGLVGWENKLKKKTALELHPAKSVTSGLFIEFECSGLVIKVRGNVLVPVKNDSMVESTELKFVAKGGKQKPEKWEENSGKQILEASFSNISAGLYEQAGQTITSVVKGEEKLELNTFV
jgi:hypothetical protein